MELNERVKVESKGVVILSYVQALDWCVRNIDDWEASWLAAEKPMGWEWIEGLGSKWLVPSCGRVTGGINKAEWLNGMKMAVTAVTRPQDFGAVADEEFTGHSDVKKYVFKVKLVKEGEDYKALSVVGISIENILNIIFHADYEGWEVVSVVRGSIIDIC